MNRAKPLTVDVVLDDVDGGSSRIETAATIFLKFFFGLYVSKDFILWDGWVAVNEKIGQNIQTPFSPDPLKIAFLPVSSITLMIFDGGSVPFILTICKSSEKEVSWMPMCILWQLALLA